MTEPVLPTTERLAQAMIQEGCPGWMITRARKGFYDDFRSDLMAPIVTLVADLRGHGFEALAKRAIDGEFDGTPEEGEAWFATLGKDLVGREMWAMFGYKGEQREKPKGFGRSSGQHKNS